jgi:transposase InsO family protein
MEIKLDLLDMLKRYSQYGWKKTAICQKWEISIKTLYGVNYPLKPSTGDGQIQLNKITPEERKAVCTYALNHTELRHREMAFRMLDEEVAYLSPSSVYRILKENNLLVKRLDKPKTNNWSPHQPALSADDIWQTDITYLKYQGRDYYLVSFMDVYSRYIVFHKLCFAMTGDTITEATKEAFEKTGTTPARIQSDNGSCYISDDFRRLMNKIEIEHCRIHPHCPNENAEIERYHRTLKEGLDVTEAKDYVHLLELVKEQIYYYGHIRYHSKIGYIPPYVKYRGNPEKIFSERERKLERATAKRMKQNFERYHQLPKLINDSSEHLSKNLEIV